MKIFFYIVFFILFIGTGSFSQTNFIRNASFEDHQTNQGNAPCKDGQSGLLEYWENDAYFPSSVFCTYNNCNGDFCDCQGCQDQIQLVGFPPEHSGFHTSDWLKTDAQFVNGGLNPFFDISEIDQNNNSKRLRGHTGSGCVGMGKAELIEQEFSSTAQSQIVIGNPHVLSLYVRIPRPAAQVGNQTLARSFLHSPCFQTSSAVNELLNVNDHFSVNVYLATNKVKYSDGLSLFCGSNSTSDFKDANSHRYLIKSFDLSVEDYPYFQWHKLTWEFNWPVEYDHNWLVIEVDGDPSAYILIDDVSLTPSCELNCTQTAGIADPHISGYDQGGNPNCVGAVISNIGNVEDLQIEIAVPSNPPQTIKWLHFINNNGFSSPVYWDGTTQAGSDAASGFYLVKTQSTNDCGTFYKNVTVFYSGCGDAPPFSNPPGSVISEKKYNDCCRNEFSFDNKVFSSFIPSQHPYSYKPRQAIYINNCTFTSISKSTFKAGTEVKITGETKISPGSSMYQGYSPEFHALIEECPDAHRLSPTESDVKGNGSQSSVIAGEISNNVVKENEADLITIEPNPTSRAFKLRINLRNYPQQIIVRDGMGRSLIVISNPDVFEYEFDLGKENSGVYFISTYFSDKVINKKVVKQ